MRHLPSPASFARRFLSGWWHGLTHDGIYVLSMYVAYHPALLDDDPAENQERNAEDASPRAVQRR